MKYIDADKLKAEIERRRLHFNKEAERYQSLNNDYSQNCYGARDALRDYENFLDTLSEKPSKSLEKAAKARKTVHRMFKKLGLDGEYIYNPTAMLVARNAFKAGAKWQKKQVSEYLDKWMEHAIRGSEKGNHIYHLGKIDLILAIQEWLKEEDEK